MRVEFSIDMILLRITTPFGTMCLEVFCYNLSIHNLMNIYDCGNDMKLSSSHCSPLSQSFVDFESVFPHKCLHGDFMHKLSDSHSLLVSDFLIKLSKKLNTEKVFVSKLRLYHSREYVPRFRINQKAGEWIK